MKFFISILVPLILLSGCSENAETVLVAGEKFSDIKPMYKNWHAGDGLSVDIIAYSIAIPKDSLVELESVWHLLIDEKIVFKNRELFDKNGFRGAIGSSAAWLAVKDMLLELDAGTSNTSILKIDDAQTDKIPLRKFHGNNIIYYHSDSGDFESVTVGSGDIALALKIESLPAVKGRVKVVLAPGYLPDKRLQGHYKHIFSEVGLSFDISPGEFLMLAPQQYPKSSSTIDGAVFRTVSKNDGLLNVYIIACGRIVE